MLLRQLTAYKPIDDESAGSRPYSRIRNVMWELALNADGTPRGDLVPLADPSDPITRWGLKILVPNTSRTSGIAPNLGADDILYVLGWLDEKSEPDWVAERHEAFAEQSRRWARERPDDPAAAAVARFYERDLIAQVAKPTDHKWSSKDLVIINVSGVPATDSDSMWQLWKTIVEERKSGGRRGLCIVCGNVDRLLDRMPQSLPKALIPRAKQEIALVSANKPIHGYDYRDKLATAPICTGCGQAAVANLTEIPQRQDAHVHLPAATHPHGVVDHRAGQQSDD